jgi:pimeloyl-ACP methyl ester carboxylesterase
MKLHYQVLGEGPALVILHGLLGSGENWVSIAKQLQDSFRVFLLDQRNHGSSPHAPSLTYPDMVSDLLGFLREHTLSPVGLVGHSMGGKTAMQFCLEYPDEVSGLVVADIAPRSYQPHLQQLLKLLRDVDLSRVNSRRDAEEALKPAIPERKVRLFLLKNLERTGSGDYRWKINIDALVDQYHEVLKGIEQKGRTYSGKTLFIRGEQSDYVEDSDMDYIRTIFPSATLFTIPKASHWLHAEAPDTFARTVRDFFTD